MNNTQDYIPEVLNLLKSRQISFPILHNNRWIVIADDPPMVFSNLKTGDRFKIKFETKTTYHLGKRYKNIVPIYEKISNNSYKLVGGFPIGTSLPKCMGFCVKTLEVIKV